MKGFIYLWFLLLIVSCNQNHVTNNEVILSGKTTDNQSKFVYLFTSNNEVLQITDTIEIINNSFYYKKQLATKQTLVFLKIDNSFPFPVFLETGKIEINVPEKNFHESVIVGSSVHDEYVNLKDSIALLLHQQVMDYKNAVIAYNDGRKEDAKVFKNNFKANKDIIFQFLQKKKGTNKQSAPFQYVIREYKDYITPEQYNLLIAE